MTMTDHSSSIAEALPSSTVALVRDGLSGPELLLVLRHGKASFANSYVFPGGLVEAQDHEVGEHCAGQDEAGARDLLELESGALAYYSAAIRELFEEAGVLLARQADGSWADSTALAPFRTALHGCEVGWADFLSQNGLSLACDALRYFAFWVTPREVRRRFSTRFFLAAIPDGQTASHCGIELTDSQWLTAPAAIESSQSPDFQLPHPTRVTLESMRSIDSVTGLMDWADRCSARGIPCNLPAVVSVSGKPTVVMPDDQLYPTYRRPGASSDG